MVYHRRPSHRSRARSIHRAPGGVYSAMRMARKASIPVRLAVLISLAGASVIGVSIWAGSPEGSCVVVRTLARIRNYHGCMCEDCTRHYLGVVAGGYGCSPTPARLREHRTGLEVAGVGGGLLLLELALGLPSRSLVSLRRTPPTRGRCQGCGYDLAGLAPDSVCPECGRGRA